MACRLCAVSRRRACLFPNVSANEQTKCGHLGGGRSSGGLSRVRKMAAAGCAAGPWLKKGKSGWREVWCVWRTEGQGGRVMRRELELVPRGQEEARGRRGSA